MSSIKYHFAMPDISRTTLIVGVFGSSDFLAESFGYEIARSGQILLTGGSGREDLLSEEKATVKEKAIAGADRARANERRPAPWIGVLRDEIDEPQCSICRAGKAITLHTDLDHKRNCLEACLCDCAIALSGGDGTRSEAIFCLSLGKPVAFIGDKWKDFGAEKPQAEPNLQAMVSSAFKRVGNITTSDSPLDVLFDQRRVRENVRSGCYRWFQSPVASDEISKTIDLSLSWLRGVSLACTGSFPKIPRYANVINSYESWLKKW